MELDERQQATDAERAEQVANEASREQGHPASKRLSRVDKIPQAAIKETIRDLGADLNTSFMMTDTLGNIVPKTPQGGLLQAQTYLMSIQPPASDLWAKMHEQAIRSLNMVGAALETPPTPRTVTAPTPAVVDKSEPRANRASRRDADPEALRSKITQSKVDRRRREREEEINKATQDRVNRSQAERAARNSPDFDEEDLYGSPCFTREIREARKPKNFKLMAETPKYDGLQEPQAWLEDYLTAVRFQRGNKTTAMQYIQLQLTGAARNWLNRRPRNEYSNWEDFEHDFVQNFKSTYKCPVTIGQLKACRQRADENILGYIQRWTVMKNNAEDISDEAAVESFKQGLRRVDLKEQIGRARVKMVSHLMETANSWADGEESVHSARPHSPEDDDMEIQYPSEGGRRYNRDFGRRRKRKVRAFAEPRTRRWLQQGLPRTVATTIAGKDVSGSHASLAPMDCRQC
jgi:hypothetical protein